jgi:hypothetical protein
MLEGSFDALDCLESLKETLTPACVSGSCDSPLIKCVTSESTCIDIEFDSDADGNLLEAGMCACENEWAWVPLVPLHEYQLI